MERIEERDLYLKMLSDLVNQRRTLTEEILLVRRHLAKLDEEIETHKEYMSATEYINLRLSIKKELEVEMRKQVKDEIEEEQQDSQEIVEEDKEIFSKDEISNSRYSDNSNKIKLDKSIETLAAITVSYLRDAVIPVSKDDLKDYLEENRNTTWKSKSFSQLLWKMKEYDARIINSSRGYYQYEEGI